MQVCMEKSHEKITDENDSHFPPMINLAGVMES